jgi:DNA-binding MarR family transcriptional regulator
VSAAREIPATVRAESVLMQLASAYFSVSKQLEQKSKCSQTRGFVLSTLRGGAALNQNQIAVALGYDRTVVHRVVKSLTRDGLVSETKAKFGKAILVQLTRKGNAYRERLIKIRRAADEKLHRTLSARDRTSLLKLLAAVEGVRF